MDYGTIKRDVLSYRKTKIPLIFGKINLPKLHVSRGYQQSNHYVVSGNF